MNQTVDKETWFESWGHKIFPLPSQLRLVRDSHHYLQARALAVMLGVIVGNSLFFLLFFTIAHFVSEESQYTENIYATLGAFLALSLQIFCFYRFANVRSSAIALSMSYFFMVLGVIIAGGGYASPYFILLLSCPIISFRLAGKDDGVMNAFFVGLSGLVFIVMHEYGFRLENYLGDISDMWSSVISWVGSIIVIMACLSIYDIDEDTT